MAAPSTRVKVTFATSVGFEFTVTFHVAAGIVDPNNAAIQAIVAAINALTGGYGLRIEITAASGAAVTPTSSAVFVNEDKAEFTFLDAGAQAHTFKLPGPKTTIVDTNGLSIPGTGAVATFLNAVAANARGPAGETLTRPTNGERRASRKSLKK